MKISGARLGPLSFHHSVTAHPKEEEFRLHTHDRAELYYFISGNGVYHVEGSRYPLNPGDLVIMRSGESHYIEIEEGAPYERIALNFPLDYFRNSDPEGRLEKPFLNRPAGKQNLYPKSLFPVDVKTAYFDRLESGNAELFLAPVLFILLSEVALLFENGALPAQAEEQPAQEIMRYLSEHLHEKLTLKSISARFYLSPSSVSRAFRQATGGSLQDYVNTKRLLHARARLQDGARPMKLYRESGFRDYSAFYRAYKKKFGHSPLKERKTAEN